MHDDQKRALLNIAIHAAMADGQKAEIERDAIRDVAQSLSGGPDGRILAGVYQDVLLRRVTLQQAAQALNDAEHRLLAYEMAVCVCDADGQVSVPEQQFLTDLRQRLGLQGSTAATQVEEQVHSLAAQAYATPTDAVAQATPAASGAAPAAAAVAGGALAAANVLDAQQSAELDKTILNYAILNGALELLPQSWASMAIIPLQIKMVYRVGKAYGVELDQGHIKEFIATLGMGLTSQYIEQFGRKLLRGLIGKAAGKALGGLAGAATGMAFSFATTYALGQLAKRYYAGGRVMSTDLLRKTYQEMLSPAKSLQQQYLPAIQQRASTLNATEVMSLVSGR